jgi:replicative DNA helicase
MKEKGLIKPLVTPFPGINDHGLGGLEWGQIYLLAARPGVGKTSILYQITDSLHDLNPDVNFAILHFQFEMSHKVTGQREFSRHTGMTLRQLNSADNKVKLGKSDHDLMKDLIAQSKGYKIFQINESKTNTEIAKEVIKFYEAMGRIPILVTLDHSILVKKSVDDADAVRVLYNLADTLNILKKNIPMSMYLILSQMKREIDDAIRKNMPGTAHYPTMNDIFGGDALPQISDWVIAMVRPYESGIAEYGQKRLITRPGLVACHYLKNRNGPMTSFYLQEDTGTFTYAEVPKESLEFRKLKS